MHDIQFLVYWEDYRNEYDQWIVEMGLQHAKEAIEDYWARLLR